MKKRTAKKNSHHTPLANSAQVTCSRCQKPILGSSSPFSSKKTEKDECQFCYVRRLQEERKEASKLEVRMQVVFQASDAIAQARIKNLETEQKEMKSRINNIEVQQKKLVKSSRLNERKAGQFLSIATESVQNTLDNSLRIDNLEQTSKDNSENISLIQAVIVPISQKVYNPNEEDKKKQLKEFNEFREEESKKIKIAELIEKSQATIYRLDTPHHIMGWSVFLVFILVAGCFYWKRKKNQKNIQGFAEEIKDKFDEWRLNIFLSTAFYVIFFVLSKEAIDK